MAQEFHYLPPQEAIPVVYQDDDLIVLNKPAGLLSVPGRGAELFDSAESRVQAVYPGAVAVHRLDRPTSGLLALSLHRRAERFFKQAFAERRVHKSYLALAAGLPAEAQGRIDLPMHCDWPNRPKQIICHVHGKEAITDYLILATDPQGRYARWQLFPRTGRSHQLRLHLASLGHPILGDNFYGGDRPEHLALIRELPRKTLSPFSAYPPIPPLHPLHAQAVEDEPRLMLHASVLEIDMMNGEHLCLQADAEF